MDPSGMADPPLPCCLLLPIDKGAAKKSTIAASRGDSEGDERRLFADWWAPSSLSPSLTGLISPLLLRATSPIVKDFNDYSRKLEQEFLFLLQE